MLVEAVTRQTPHLYDLPNELVVEQAVKLATARAGVRWDTPVPDIPRPFSELIKHPTWKSRRVSNRNMLLAQEKIEANPESIQGMDPLARSLLPETLGRVYDSIDRSISAKIGWLTRREVLRPEYVNPQTGKLDIAALETTEFFQNKQNHPLLEALTKADRKGYHLSKRSRLMKAALSSQEYIIPAEVPVEPPARPLVTTPYEENYLELGRFFQRLKRLNLLHLVAEIKNVAGKLKPSGQAIGATVGLSLIAASGAAVPFITSAFNAISYPK